MGLLKPIHAQTSVAVHEAVARKLKQASLDENEKRVRLAREQLEKIGAPKTRLLLTTGDLARHLVAPAAHWLAELDENDRTRNKAFQVSQMRIALSAERAAWIAAFAAISAAAIATGTGLLAIFMPVLPSR